LTCFSQTTGPFGTKLGRNVTSWVVISIFMIFLSLGNPTCLLGPILLSDLWKFNKSSSLNYTCDNGNVTWYECSSYDPLNSLSFFLSIEIQDGHLRNGLKLTLSGKKQCEWIKVNFS
jgi:hypothetical protein